MLPASGAGRAQCGGEEGANAGALPQTQQGTALGFHETELDGAMTGTKVGISIQNRAEELREGLAQSEVGSRQ